MEEDLHPLYLAGGEVSQQTAAEVADGVGAAVAHQLHGVEEVVDGPVDGAHLQAYAVALVQHVAVAVFFLRTVTDFREPDAISPYRRLASFKSSQVVTKRSDRFRYTGGEKLGNVLERGDYRLERFDFIQHTVLIGLENVHYGLLSVGELYYVVIFCIDGNDKFPGVGMCLALCAVKYDIMGCIEISFDPVISEHLIILRVPGIEIARSKHSVYC